MIVPEPEDIPLHSLIHTALLDWRFWTAMSIAIVFVYISALTAGLVAGAGAASFWLAFLYKSKQ